MEGTVISQLVAGIVTALLGYMVKWAKDQKVFKEERWAKVTGIAKHVMDSPELVAQAATYLASKTPWSWDDALLSEINKRLTGQAADGLSTEERKKIREMFPAPPVSTAPLLEQELSALRGAGATPQPAVAEALAQPPASIAVADHGSAVQDAMKRMRPVPPKPGPGK